MPGRSGRSTVVRRVRGNIGAATEWDYASAFEVDVLAGRDAAGWARAVFEGAPAHRLLWLGWRFGLGLRLGPLAAPGAVLGWPLGTESAAVATLRADSPLLRACNEVRLDGGLLRWTTLVRYQNRLGRALWTVTAPVHHLIIPALLRRAVH